MSNKQSCSHNAYWTTAYNSDESYCMACRAEKAEQQLEQFKGIFGDYNEPSRTIDQARAMWNALKQRLATVKLREDKP